MKYEVISFAAEWDKIEAKGLGGRTRGNTTIGFPDKDGVRGSQMAIGDAFVAAKAFSGHTGGADKAVEESAATGATLAIHERNVSAMQIIDPSNVFWIARSDHEPLFPAGEGDNCHVLVYKLTADKGQVELAALGILQVR